MFLIFLLSNFQRRRKTKTILSIHKKIKLIIWMRNIFFRIINKFIKIQHIIKIVWINYRVLTGVCLVDVYVLDCIRLAATTVRVGTELQHFSFFPDWSEKSFYGIAQAFSESSCGQRTQRHACIALFDRWDEIAA